MRGRQRVAEQKGEAVVVIFKIDALSHSGRVLVDKAEDAVVAAAALLIHKVGFKLQTQVIVLLLFYRNREVLSVSA